MLERTAHLARQGEFRIQNLSGTLNRASKLGVVPSTEAQLPIRGRVLELAPSFSPEQATFFSRVLQSWEGEVNLRRWKWRHTSRYSHSREEPELGRCSAGAVASEVDEPASDRPPRERSPPELDGSHLESPSVLSCASEEEMTDGDSVSAAQAGSAGEGGEHILSALPRREGAECSMPDAGRKHAAGHSGGDGAAGDGGVSEADWGAPELGGVDAPGTALMAELHTRSTHLHESSTRASEPSISGTPLMMRAPSGGSGSSGGGMPETRVGVALEEAETGHAEVAGALDSLARAGPERPGRERRSRGVVAPEVAWSRPAPLVLSKHTIPVALQVRRESGFTGVPR